MVLAEATIYGTPALLGISLIFFMVSLLTLSFHFSCYLYYFLFYLWVYTFFLLEWNNSFYNFILFIFLHEYCGCKCHPTPTPPPQQGSVTVIVGVMLRLLYVVFHVHFFLNILWFSLFFFLKLIFKYFSFTITGFSLKYIFEGYCLGVYIFNFVELY